MTEEQKKYARNIGWIPVDNGGWIIYKNFVTDDFADRLIVEKINYWEEIKKLRIGFNNVINNVVNIVEDNTPEIKGNPEWRNLIFDKIAACKELHQPEPTK